MNRWATRPTSHVTTDRRMSIFDQAERKKQEGMNAAYSHAPSIWKEAAGEAITHVALNIYEFTTDEIWERLSQFGIHTAENRAMGAVIQAGLRSGVIERTGEWRQTQRIEAHKRPLAIWRSKIFRG